MTIVVKPEQNIFDLALKYYGNADYVYDIILLNQYPNGYNSVLRPGNFVKIDQYNNKITNYLQNKDIATGEIPLRTIGHIAIKLDFIIKKRII